MKKTVISILILILTIGTAASHTTVHKGKVHAFGNETVIDSVSLYKIFHNNAPVDFHTPGIPSTAYVGHEGMFLVGIGGFAKSVMGWDFGHPIDDPDEFATSAIPMHPMNGNDQKFNISAKQSHLFVNFVALPGSENEFGAFISANFMDGYKPHLQFAYMKYRGIQAGYEYSLFADPACNAPAIDYEGPCASTTSPVASVRYCFNPDRNKRWELGISLEYPEISVTNISDRTTVVNQRVPDVPIAAKYSWAGGESWVKGMAIMRNMYYRNLAQARNIDKIGYGFQLTGAVQFLEKFKFLYQGVWGNGIASLIQDTENEGLDLVPTAGGKLKSVPAWGATAAVTYDITEKFCVSATYSQVRTYADRFNDGENVWGDMYKYGQYFSTNFFWHIFSYLDTGVEYLWGRRANYDGMKCSDNRVQAMLQLSF